MPASTPSANPRPYSCVACGESAVPSRKAIISPWIRDRCSLTIQTSLYCWCKSCGSGQFSVRYDPDEMDLLYSGYRDQAYFQVRHAWEPSYSRSFNDAFGRDAAVVEARQAMLQELLHSVSDPSAAGIAVALDVGGDLGQFLPNDIPERYVLDPSDRPLVGGVNRLFELEDARQLDIELVVMTGVLEHLEDPLVHLRDIRSVASSPRAIYILSVPAGTPAHRGGLLESAIHRLGLIASTWRPAWAAWDAVVAVARRSGLPIGAFAPFRQSEHLSFFSPSGLRKLCERSGLDVLLLKELAVPGELTQSGRLQFSRDLYAVCRPRDDR